MRLTRGVLAVIDVSRFKLALGTALCLMGIGSASATLIRGEFEGIVLGVGTHGTINQESIANWAGSAVTGFFTYESAALTNRSPVVATSYVQHYAFNPVTPAEISVTVEGYTFSVVGDLESAVSVGNNYFGHNWFEPLVIASDGQKVSNLTQARLTLENFGGAVGNYVNNIDDISAVNFTATPPSSAPNGPSNAGYVLNIWGFSENQLLYQINSITVGPASLFIPPTDPNSVPEPDTYALMLTGLGLLGFMSRRKMRSS